MLSMFLCVQYYAEFQWAALGLLLQRMTAARALP